MQRVCDEYASTGYIMTSMYAYSMSKITKNSNEPVSKHGFFGLGAPYCSIIRSVRLRKKGYPIAIIGAGPLGGSNLSAPSICKVIDFKEDTTVRYDGLGMIEVLGLYLAYGWEIEETENMNNGNYLSLGEMTEIQ